MPRSIIEQLASAMVQIIAAISGILILVLDKGMGKFEETLSWYLYIMLGFVALGAKLKDIREIFVRIMIKDLSIKQDDKGKKDIHPKRSNGASHGGDRDR